MRCQRRRLLASTHAGNHTKQSPQSPALLRLWASEASHSSSRLRSARCDLLFVDDDGGLLSLWLRQESLARVTRQQPPFKSKSLSTAPATKPPNLGTLNCRRAAFGSGWALALVAAALALASCPSYLEHHMIAMGEGMAVSNCPRVGFCAPLLCLLPAGGSAWREVSRPTAAPQVLKSSVVNWSLFLNPITFLGAIGRNSAGKCA